MSPDDGFDMFFFYIIHETQSYFELNFQVTILVKQNVEKRMSKEKKNKIS